MEPTFLFALLSALSAGLYSFTTKVSAHLKHHAAQVTYYSAVSSAILSGIYVLSTSPSFSRLGLVFVVALLDAVAYAGVSITRVDALKFMDSTLFFPLYKVFSSIFAVPLGILVFSDRLSLFEGVGIAVGILAPILLVTKAEHARQGNLKKGLGLLWWSVVFALAATAASKSVPVLGLDPSVYTFIVCALGMPIAHVYYRKTNRDTHERKYAATVGLLGGLFIFGNLYFIVRAYAGDMSTAFVINSFSTVLVVALSVVVFHEHLNARKIAALFATVVSLVLLK